MDEVILRSWARYKQLLKDTFDALMKSGLTIRPRGLNFARIESNASDMSSLGTVFKSVKTGFGS